MIESAPLSCQTHDDHLAALQQQLLVVAIYAGAVRAELAQPLVRDAQHAYTELLEQVEAVRHSLEQQIALGKRVRVPWWRRWRRSLRHHAEPAH